jgi:hypothetical protein
MNTCRFALAVASVGAVALGLAWSDTLGAQVKARGIEKVEPKAPKVGGTGKAVPTAPKVGGTDKASPKAPKLGCYQSPPSPKKPQRILMSKLPPPGICVGFIAHHATFDECLICAGYPDKVIQRVGKNLYCFEACKKGYVPLPAGSLCCPGAPPPPPVIK